MWTFWDVILALTVYPILEELVFRGGLQPWFTRLYGHQTVFYLSAANLLTSSCFSIAHLIPRGLETALLVFVPSLILGWYKERGLSINGCIGLHATANALYFLGLLLVRAMYHQAFFQV